jgi:porphobilinogen synthase
MEELAVLMKRLMRLRNSQHLRDLCAETEFNRAQLIQPFFVVEGLGQEEPIPGLRGNVRHNIPSVLRQIEKDLQDGVTHFLLFPVPSKKKESGFNHQSTQETISQIRKQFGKSLCLWIDTCLCSYTTHGHCAVLDEQGIKLEQTLDELAKSAVAFAEAGADGISPSDMMDGRVARIPRRAGRSRFQSGTGDELQHQIRQQLLRAVSKRRRFRSSVWRPPPLST